MTALSEADWQTVVERVRELFNEGLSQVATSVTGSLVASSWQEQAAHEGLAAVLRRVVQAADVVEHCDFDEHASMRTPDGVLRPDLVVRLAGGRTIVVDAKAPLEGVHGLHDDHERGARLKVHARMVKEHVDQLAAKSYWLRFDPVPVFVVMFVPSETFIHTVIEQEPDLLNYALERRVVFATPSTFIAMCRMIVVSPRPEAVGKIAERQFGELIQDMRKARGWSQEELAKRMTDSGFPMHQVTVGKIENAARPTSVGEICALADIFGTQAPNLLRPPGEDPKLQALELSMGEVRRLYGEISVIEAQIHELERKCTKLGQEYVEAVDWYRTAASAAEPGSPKLPRYMVNADHSRIRNMRGSTRSDFATTPWREGHKDRGDTESKRQD